MSDGALAEAAAARRERDRLASARDEVETRRAAREREAERLAKTLAEEREDVEDLEGLSLTSLLASLTGRRSERLEKEREEFVRARLAHEECVAELDELRREREELDVRIEALGDVDARYAAARAERERVIAEGDDEVGKELRALVDRLSELESEVEEIEGAMRSGRRARKALRRVSDRVAKARTWGLADLAGGGFVVTAAKYGALDESRDLARRAQRHLRAFGRKLGDVGRAANRSLEIPGGLEFVDHFLDGLVADWLVQRRIDRGLHDSERMVRRVNRSLRDLERLRESALDRIDALELRREELIGPDVA